MSVLASPEYVSSGSRMTWTGQFSSTFWNVPLLQALTPNDAVQQVSATLKNHYSLVVERADNGTSWAGLSGGSITLYLRSDIDRGDGETDDGLTDIMQNVNDAFVAVGCSPLSSAITDYTAASGDGSPSATVKVATAATTVAEQQILAAAEAAKKAAQPSWWDNLVSKFEVGSIGFAVGAVAVIGVVVFIAVKQEAV